MIRPSRPTFWILFLVMYLQFFSTNLRNLGLNHVYLQIGTASDGSDFTFLKAVMGCSPHFFQPR
jgi:hypothetical protein